MSRRPLVHLLVVLGAALAGAAPAGAAPAGAAPAGAAPARAGLIERGSAAVSRWLGNVRIFHRDGEAYQARLEIPKGSLLLPEGGTADSIVRVSRGMSLRQPKRDVLGLAVRVGARFRGDTRTPVGDDPAAHDDLLLVTSKDGGWFGRRLPRLSRSFLTGPYSSLLSFEGAEEKYLVRAYPMDKPLHGTMTDLGQVEDAVASGTVRFQLKLEGVRSRRQVDLGVVVLERALTAAESAGLKYRPWQNRTLRPSGLLNRLRRLVYRGSQSTR